jgi:hypothetical protein
MKRLLLSAQTLVPINTHTLCLSLRTGRNHYAIHQRLYISPSQTPVPVTNTVRKDVLDDWFSDNEMEGEIGGCIAQLCLSKTDSLLIYLSSLRSSDNKLLTSVDSHTPLIKI